MKRIFFLVTAIYMSWQVDFAQQAKMGLRGDPAAITDAKAMVDTMGGIAIWANVKSVHFVHEWYPLNRVDSYIENEILDLDGPRSWADRKSEINHSTRAYSPEGKRWSLDNGKFAYASVENLEQDLARAPFNFYRLIRGVAVDDPYRIICVVDCGQVVNPLGLEGQVESGIVWGLSAALHGKISFKHGRVEQSSYRDFEVLRMNEMPKIETYTIPKISRPFGIGEQPVPPVAPAVANAIFAATGKRLRRVPFDLG